MLRQSKRSKPQPFPVSRPGRPLRRTGSPLRFRDRRQLTTRIATFRQAISLPSARLEKEFLGPASRRRLRPAANPIARLTKRFAAPPRPAGSLPLRFGPRAHCPNLAATDAILCSGQQEQVHPIGSVRFGFGRVQRRKGQTTRRRRLLAVIDQGVISAARIAGAAPPFRPQPENGNGLQALLSRGRTGCSATGRFGKPAGSEGWSRKGPFFRPEGVPVGIAGLKPSEPQTAASAETPP